MPESTKDLFERYLRNECSPEEVRQLLTYFQTGDMEEEMKIQIRQFLSAGEPDKVPEHLLETATRMQKETMSALFPTAARTRLYLRPWFRYSAAAAVLGIIITTALLTFRSGPTTRLAKNEQSSHAIKPAQFGATLTLADGNSIALDSAANGLVAHQNGANITKSNGALTYEQNAAAANKEVINQVATQRGNHYQLVLSDGTKVWLNAASSIRFPANFSPTERKVEVKGEAYFEVASNPNKPFRVKILSPKGQSEVEVLGTHFNVHAYDDESTAKTTLLEGRIRVVSGKASKLLVPGQQAIVGATEQIDINNNVDRDQVMSWINGVFIFDHENIRTIMQQISRWYDVEVVYNNPHAGETFSGVVSRDGDVTQVLKIMEANGLTFKIENKTIIIQ
ncbi:FecR family protein [Chitinophaga sp.]|uniref:FecR family protein n=1 Tax=Chitinophaga sp. TaxID=1869181 RepID=UPI002F950418